MLEVSGTLSPDEARSLLERADLPEIIHLTDEIAGDFNAELARPGSRARSISDAIGTISRSRIFAAWIHGHPRAVEAEQRSNELLARMGESSNHRQQALLEGAVYALRKDGDSYRYASRPAGSTLPAEMRDDLIACIRMALVDAYRLGFEWILLHGRLVNVSFAIRFDDWCLNQTTFLDHPVPDTGATVQGLCCELARTPPDYARKILGDCGFTAEEITEMLGKVFVL
jgi:hypothetical protein